MLQCRGMSLIVIVNNALNMPTWADINYVGIIYKF